MIGILNRLLRRDGATVPSMDGVLRPNALLEKATVLATVAEPDNLVTVGDALVFSSGQGIFRLSSGGLSSLIYDCGAPVTALASAPDSSLAAGITATGIRLFGGAHDGLLLRHIGPRPARGPTALAFGDADTLFVCLGSAHNEAEEWQRDLMEQRSSGSVWKVDLKTRAATCIADGLGFPNGILVRGEGVVVSESWNHRLLRFDGTGGRPRPQIVLEDLPGYPGRLSAAADGGAWLAVFAPRSQLIEFVLRERPYCTRMLREIPKELWIAPSLRSGRSFREPMQGGAVRVHGIFKPWAPTRSYGLAIRLDHDLQPLRSFHSRADGTRHGLVSIQEWRGGMVFASRGDGVLGALSPDGLTLADAAQ
ncbi:MAG: hypothetical protein KJ670_16015 [Alphaproteobacteria bacterium]|nr:hypothetical protein [Rhizobiaceae bacterium]MBU3963336.1 hypothetical protein [Alphaproteobacteria bacterium]MBU4052436.1 hypothetical protein [Alphaproteobacteria bacterium]MBU4090216.1 hypothetical protein [Alphaproteobacteria bacterium]MBU4156461.1 hypothetical protein [Alphaproteobacteria bacterium]